MPRSKRRLRVKRHRRGGCGMFLFLLALLLLGAACWRGYRQMCAQIDVAAGRFMQRVEAGDEEGAISLLLEREGGEAALASLMALFDGPGYTYRGAARGRPTGLFSGRALVYFTVDGSLHTASLQLVRRRGEWLVESLPEVKIMDGALVEKVARDEQGDSPTVQLLWLGERMEIPAPAGLAVAEGMVARVQLFGDAAIFAPLEEMRLSRLLRLSDSECEGELEGNLPLKAPLSVYLVEREPAYRAEQGSLQDLVVGMSDLVLYLSEGGVAAAKVEKGAYLPRTIRVLLRQNLHQLSEESLFHRQIRLNSAQPYTLEERRSGALLAFEPGQSVLVEPAGELIKVTPEGLESMEFAHRLFVYAREGGAMIVKGLVRDGWPGRDPAYRGILEIANQGGELVLVNELSLEEYLYTVVPAEMPVSFGAEALKAQAVAARSYAYRTIFSSGFSRYGAHVDDSVMSQVYNNRPEDPLATAAVEETAGLVLFYGDAVADARFFSSSCGHTANYHEVWSDPDGGAFPAAPIPYLKALSQVPGESFNLKDEGEMERFLERADWPAYDALSPFFRWRVEMSGEQLTEAINRNLAPRYQAQPGSILTREGGEFRSLEIPRNPLGRLLDIRVLQRGEGGNIMVLEIEGTNGTYRILKEYNIRAVIRPVNYLPGAAPVVLQCHDGRRLQDYDILPSAFAVFEVERNEQGEAARVLIAGGGNGHGVGMSQYGAAGMARQGHDFKEILQHFYPGTELRPVYPAL